MATTCLGTIPDTRFEPHIEFRAVQDLTPYPRNARTHSKRQVRQIAASIEEFGFTNPVLINAEGQIIAGHGRVEAAKLIDMSKVPAIRIEHLSEDQIRAYVIADNKLAENAGWDQEMLAIELETLISLETSFDVELTGFETCEIDLLIDEHRTLVEASKADEIPEPSENQEPVSKLGDLWLLGPHRLLCHDATDPMAYELLMQGDKARAVFIDPPYNVPIDGHVSGLGVIKHREFAMASGEMSSAAFAAFLSTVFENLAGVSVDGSIHYVCMDWRHMTEVLSAGDRAYTELKNLCVWAKTNAGMGSFYRSQHELVFVFKNGKAPHLNTFELGQFGRHRSNVWSYAGANTLKADRMSELQMHPTVKPVALVADAIRDVTKRGDIVLDSFAGSGSTLIAAEETGRRAYCIELDCLYVDTTIRRWQNLTGERARNTETDEFFKEPKN